MANKKFWMYLLNKIDDVKEAVVYPKLFKNPSYKQKQIAVDKAESVYKSLRLSKYERSMIDDYITKIYVANMEYSCICFIMGLEGRRKLYPFLKGRSYKYGRKSNHN